MISFSNIIVFGWVLLALGAFIAIMNWLSRYRKIDLVEPDFLVKLLNKTSGRNYETTEWLKKYREKATVFSVIKKTYWLSPISELGLCVPILHVLIVNSPGLPEFYLEFLRLPLIFILILLCFDMIDLLAFEKAWRVLDDKHLAQLGGK
jgi:hypothetical protein